MRQTERLAAEVAAAERPEPDLVIWPENASDQDPRSEPESRSAAASTAGACMRPGWRVNRSSGPDTDTAAMILPEGERTGADTEATPASRSPTDWAHPRRRMPESAVAE